MSWSAPRTWSPGETVTAQLMNLHVRDNMNILKTPINDDGTLQLIPSKGGVIVNPNGIENTINVIVWRAPFACTVVAVKGYRVGGTSASINARKNGSSNHLASAKSLTSANTWMDGGAVQNTAYAIGDKLEIMLTAVGGDPTQIGVQVDLSVP